MGEHVEILFDLDRASISLARLLSSLRRAGLDEASAFAIEMNGDGLEFPETGEWMTINSDVPCCHINAILQSTVRSGAKVAPVCISLQAGDKLAKLSMEHST